MRKFLFFLLSTVPFLSFGQNFSFYPSAAPSTWLEMDVYTDTQVDITPFQADTTWISWRMVENTCPESWSFVLCDWAACYDYLPNNGEMDPVANGTPGLLKLTANPHQTPGSGFVRFWVYPTGLMNERQEVFFYYETTVASLEEALPVEASCFPIPASQEVTLRHLPSGECRIFSSSGQLMLVFQAHAGLPVNLPVAAWPAGKYVVHSPNSKMSFIVLH